MKYAEMIEKYIDRFSNELDLQKELQYTDITMKFTRRETIELKIFLSWLNDLLRLGEE